MRHLFQKSFPLAIFMLLSWMGYAQDSIPAKVLWSFTTEKVDATTFKLSIHGRIEKNWRLLSLSLPDDLPNSRLSFDSSVAPTRILQTFESSSIKKESNALLGVPLSFYTDTVDWNALVRTNDTAQQLRGTITYMVYQGENFEAPVAFEFKLIKDGQGNWTSKDLTLSTKDASADPIKRSAIDILSPQEDCGGTGSEGVNSLWRIFLLGALGGLLALIMPCTFPMIPMTVSFFTKKAGDTSKGVRNAFLYGFFIFIIYVLLSVPFYFLESGNADLLNNISTNAWLNLFFALVFFVFALSFFGLFEIGLPSHMANKTDAKSDISSLGGIFFMALTLAIVSFSCTGPILGTLLVGALNQDGGAVQLTVAMAGFGLALGLPFGLFALFPKWLSTLPRSGSWMTTVKIVFAFVELALMIKFLSNADLVMHWGLLKREVFFAIWIMIGLATALYLYGILVFKHDPPPAKLSVGRKIAATAFLVFSIYLIPGLTNTKYAHISLVSGFPPPLSNSIYKHDDKKKRGVEANVVNDYEAALKLAKEKKKPLLIDFTGWACVNCRKMEENVWTDPDVAKLIEENFILVSLYVDDRKPLPEAEQFLHIGKDGSRKSIKTYGDLFASMQAENFNNASQPLYVILSPEEKLLNRPVGYTPDVKTYREWLECGKR